jgi:hypothetical protein
MRSWTSPTLHTNSIITKTKRSTSYVRPNFPNFPISQSRAFEKPPADVESTDTPELFPGTPVGLQLIGRTLEEEAVIGMTEVVDNALKKFRGDLSG